MASAPRGLADLVARELAGFGATDIKERSTGVAFQGGLPVAYRACLESRLANRIFLEIAHFEARDAAELYAAVRAIDWTAHVSPTGTLACDFSGRHPSITHSHFGALKLKDAIVDAVRDATGERPSIAVDRPSVRVHAHARDTQITVSIDLSGESLHRRGYRGAAGQAPLKENVAAGMLMRAGWAQLAASGAQFLDPMCGSGTLVIEAALIAAQHAPGLGREYYGFLGWRGHDSRLWRELLLEARLRSRAQEPTNLLIRGRDRDPGMIQVAQSNADRAGIAHHVSFEAGALADAEPGAQGAHRVESRRKPTVKAPTLESAERDARGVPRGLVCVNPPYGVRLEDRDASRVIHRELGAVLKARFQGWQAAVLTGAPELGLELGIRAYRTHTLWNGGLECRLLRLKVEPESDRESRRLARRAALRGSPGAQMFGNRLTKNLRQLRRWAQRDSVSCYRLYDADMPEYAFAIDYYRTLDPEVTWLYVQEYEAPAEIEPEAARRRRQEALSVLPDVTGVAAERIRLRTRRRTRRGDQYSKVAHRASFHTVLEGGLRFRVNFDDYLDTGLFLDHRLTRARIGGMARGKRFLNLFAYTGTATVYAACGGAETSTSVDLSNTYLEWAEQNLALNALADPAHALVQADCREWLAGAAG